MIYTRLATGFGLLIFIYSFFLFGGDRGFGVVGGDEAVGQFYAATGGEKGKKFKKTKVMEKNKMEGKKAMEEGLYAEINTSKGKILVKLYEEEVGLTVANFVGLAEGTKEYTVGGKRGEGPFYDGLIFHRVVDNFVIQGGDPLGNGTGGPGYRFEDEVSWKYKHSGAGILSMANSGPDSNGSQFFITLGAAPWLDGKHSIFGEVIEGMGVVEKIREGDKIKRVKIIREGKKYKDYKILESDFRGLRAKIGEAKNEVVEKEIKDFLRKHWPKAKRSEMGGYYVIKKEGKGDRPKKGDTISAHYRGSFTDGKMFDDSYLRNEPIKFPVGVGKVIKGWDEALLSMRKGEKRVLILPPSLGYGKNSVGPIPGNSILVFEIELVDIQ